MRKRSTLKRRQFRSRTITGWVTAAAGLIMLILLLRTGSAGATLMRRLFGIAAYAFPFLLMVWGGLQITRERRSARLSGGVVRAAAGLLLFCWAVGTAELLSVPQTAALDSYLSHYGGAAGSLLFHSLNGVVSTGTSIFFSAAGISILIAVLLRAPIVRLLEGVERAAAAGRKRQ
jgi:hypothetical protein